jgi:hypothetical protein
MFTVKYTTMTKYKDGDWLFEMSKKMVDRAENVCMD